MWPPEDCWRAPVGDFPPPWASAWGDDDYGLWADLVVKGVTQRMRWIEPSGPEGFWMGSTKAERDKIIHKSAREWTEKYESEPIKVVIDEGFWLADTPCTQAFWQAVTGSNPSRFKGANDAAERPVESVNVKDVEGFLNALSQRPGANLDGRPALPNEEQWEYAARAGSRTSYWWGDDLDPRRANIDWTNDKSFDDPQGTTPVHQFAPNLWGLYDVHGNVWEWCADPWRARLDRPEGEEDSSARAVRGGSWISRPGFARSAFRGGRPLDGRFRSLGFRLVLRSTSPAAR